ncbi:MAG: DUF1501 domain-containing protein [Pirellulales bacterium]
MDSGTHKRRQTDGSLSRRSWLRAGVAGGLTLAGLLRAETQAGIRQSRRAVINVHLDGGPPQMDMIDPKPNAPVEIRGEFSSIATRVPGLALTEWLPRLADEAQKFVFIRSLVGAEGQHDAFQCQSGWNAKSLAAIGGRPALGSVVARLQGSPTDSAPAFVDLMQGRPFVRNSARPGFLGPTYQPFRPDISQWFERPLEEGMKRELAARGADHAIRLTLDERLANGRLADRTALAAQLDRFRRDADSSRMMDALDAFSQQAVGILTSGRFAAALDLGREDPRIVERYLPASGATGPLHSTSEGPGAARKFLLARRLVEAGVRCVSISLSDFDTHSDNFGRMRNLLPTLDHGLTALVTDLEERDLLDDVAIVVWGEFGRTPKIDAKTGGRHHWPAVGMCLLAGGGFRTGQVIGATDRDAGQAVSRPVHYQDVFATLYHHLGIHPAHATLLDPAGRPQHLLDVGQPIREIV